MLLRSEQLIRFVTVIRIWGRQYFITLIGTLSCPGDWLEAIAITDLTYSFDTGLKWKRSSGNGLRLTLTCDRSRLCSSANFIII